MESASSFLLQHESRNYLVQLDFFTIPAAIPRVPDVPANLVPVSKLATLVTLDYGLRRPWSQVEESLTFFSSSHRPNLRQLTADSLLFTAACLPALSLNAKLANVIRGQLSNATGQQHKYKHNFVREKRRGKKNGSRLLFTPFF